MNPFPYIAAALRRFVAEDDAQDLLEYALLATVIALVCVAGINLLTSAIANVFSGVATEMQNTGTGAGAGS